MESTQVRRSAPWSQLGIRMLDEYKRQVLILDHDEDTVLEAEALQEPQHDGRKQNDGTGTLDEGPAALPGGTRCV